MRKYIFIGCGGVAGAILRNFVQYGGMPFDTLSINTLGCFLLSLMLSVSLEILERSPNLRLGIASGFLGSSMKRYIH